MTKSNKKKNKQKPLADKTRHRQEKVRSSKANSTAENPFELKINHQKHQILGRKLTKFDKGRPGVSRSKAIDKRKNTLLVEYEKRGRANQFSDQRLGEHDPTLSADDKLIRRFALERKHHGQADVRRRVEEAEEEEEETLELTHHGQSLADIEKFIDTRLSDDDESDDDDKGRLSAKLVGEQHFGGFLKRKAYEEEGESGGGVKKSHRELMEEIIAKSKKAKYERQTEKERTLALTEKLDQEWKEFGWKEFEIFRQAVKANREDDKAKEKDKDKADKTEKTVDKYDMAVKQLQFEARGQPTDRIKSQEEIQKQEAEERAKQEAALQRRMAGGTGDQKTVKRIIPSADSLDDEFYLPDYSKNKNDNDDDDSDNDDDGDEKASDMENNEDGSASDEDDDDDDNDVEDDDDDDDDELEMDTEETQEIDDDDDDDDDEDDAMKHMSDLEDSGDENEDDDDDNDDDENDDDDDESEDTEIKPEMKSETNVKSSKLNGRSSDKNQVKSTTEVKVVKEDKKGNEVKEKNEVTVDEKPTNEKKTSLQDNLTGFIRLADRPLTVESSREIDRLTAELYHCTQKSPSESAVALLGILMERQKALFRESESETGKVMTGKERRKTLQQSMLLLKLTHSLFPTSDLRHAVTTPAMLFLCQILARYRVRSVNDVVVGLFLASLCLEYVSLSKRFVPEAINFLRGVLLLASPEKHLAQAKPPYKLLVKNQCGHLRLDAAKCDYTSSPVLSLSVGFSESKENQENLKVDCLVQCLRLIQHYSKLYSHLDSFTEIFAPLLTSIRLLPKDKYHISVQTQCTSLIETLSQERSYQPLVRANKRPQPLKTFTPKFEDKFDGRKKRGGGAEMRSFNDKQRMMNKYKKEMKGAKREIRKDQQFLATVKLQQQRDRDEERERKTKAIMGQLSRQEGEVKALRKNNQNKNKK